MQNDSKGGTTRCPRVILHIRKSRQCTTNENLTIYMIWFSKNQHIYQGMYNLFLLKKHPLLPLSWQEIDLYDIVIWDPRILELKEFNIWGQTNIFPIANSNHNFTYLIKCVYTKIIYIHILTWTPWWPLRMRWLSGDEVLTKHKQNNAMAAKSLNFEKPCYVAMLNS